MTATPVRPQKPSDEYGHPTKRYKPNVMPPGAFTGVYTFDDKSTPHQLATSRPEAKRFDDKGGPTRV